MCCFAQKRGIAAQPFDPAPAERDKRPSISPLPERPLTDLRELLSHFTGAEVSRSLAHICDELTEGDGDAVQPSAESRDSSSDVLNPNELGQPREGAPRDAPYNESEAVKAWVQSAAVVENSGVLHLAFLLFERLLTTSRAARQGDNEQRKCTGIQVVVDAAGKRRRVEADETASKDWIWLMSSPEEDRCKLRQSLLELEDALAGRTACIWREAEPASSEVSTANAPRDRSSMGLFGCRFVTTDRRLVHATTPNQLDFPSPYLSPAASPVLTSWMHSVHVEC